MQVPVPQYRQVPREVPVPVQVPVQVPRHIQVPRYVDVRWILLSGGRRDGNLEGCIFMYFRSVHHPSALLQSCSKFGIISILRMEMQR